MNRITDRRVIYLLAVLAALIALAAGLRYSSAAQEAQEPRAAPSQNLPKETLRTVQVAAPKASQVRDVLIRAEKVPEHLRVRPGIREPKAPR
jgi:hypothetical protein